MFLNNRKKITSCFDGLNIPSYLAYSTFTNQDFYGLLSFWKIWTAFMKKVQNENCPCLSHIPSVKDRKPDSHVRRNVWSILFALSALNPALIIFTVEFMNITLLNHSF